MESLLFPIKEGFDYRITQEYGNNRSNYYAKYNLLGHNGQDIGCATGTPYVAVSDATVLDLKNDVKENDHTSLGNYIRLLVSLDRPNAFYEVMYGHCLSILVKQGDKVSRRDTIALGDNTGDSTGPHLHFGVRIIERRTPKNGEKGNIYFGVKYTVLDYDNGFGGYIDPVTLYETVVVDKLPVDVRYGETQSTLKEVSFNTLHRNYAKKRLAAVGKQLDDRHYNALCYGHWSIEKIVSAKDEDFAHWSNFTFPAFRKLIGQ